MKNEKKPELLHEHFESLTRLLKPVKVKRFVVPANIPEVQFDENDITRFLKTVMRSLINTNRQPLAFEEYNYQRKEFRYSVLIDGVCIWLIVEEAAVEKSKFDAGVNE